MSFERNIWADDLDPVKAAHEGAWTALGRDYLYTLHLETHRLLGLPALPRASVEAAYQMPVDRIIAKADNSRIERVLHYSNALRRFRELWRAGRASPQHARDIASILADKWFGDYRLQTRAQARAVRNWLAGYLRYHPRAPRPATPPVTWQEADRVYRLGDTRANSIRWAEAHAAEHVTSLKERARHTLAETLLAAQAEGASPMTTASTLLTRMGTLNRDWRTIAITEQAMNHAHGELAGLVGEKVEWIAAADACRYCKQFAGQVFEVVSPDAPHKDFWKHVWAGKTNVGRSFAPRTRDGRARTLEELAGPAIPAHPHCLVGNTLVTAQGVSAYSKRWYQGAIVTITTRQGNRLTCTPNHPVLTPSGWVAAGLLDVGGNVIGSVRRDRVVVGGLNDEYVETPVEEIANALAESPEVTSAPVPLAPIHFHGDGGGSEVAVVGAYRHLWDGNNATFEQELMQLLLLRRVESTFGLFGLRVQNFGREFHRAAASGFVSSAHLALALLFAHALPLQRFGLASSARRNPGLVQPLFDGFTTDAVRFRQSLDRLAGVVSGDELAGVDLDASDENALAIPNLHDSPFSGMVDEIVAVSRQRFRGHVYNLETQQGYYVANGIITHNCRCRWRRVIATAQADPRLLAYLRTALAP